MISCWHPGQKDSKYSVMSTTFDLGDGDGAGPGDGPGDGPQAFAVAKRERRRANAAFMAVCRDMGVCRASTKASKHWKHVDRGTGGYLEQ